MSPLVGRRSFSHERFDHTSIIKTILLRQIDGRVLRQVSEANVGPSVVLVFRAGGVGQTTVSLALTKGDASTKALESRRFLVQVR